MPQPLRSPAPLIPGLLDAPTFEALAAEYWRHCRLRVSVVDASGAWVHRHRNAPLRAPTPALRVQAVQEALRWGEPCVMSDQRHRAFWAVPLSINQKLVGGLLVSGVPLRRTEKSGGLDRRVVAGCESLLEIATAFNLVNASLLAAHRELATRERQKAEALRAAKEGLYDNVRSVYLREEPALIAAIRRGERTNARHIINRVLTAIYVVGESRMDLLKSMALELVVTLARTAVQSGGDPITLLGINYQSLTTLSHVQDQEDLAAWLRAMLELLIDAIHATARQSTTAQLTRAIEHVEQHLADPLTREDVARVAGLSPSHFSHLMRAKTGCTFTELLTQLRLGKARELLLRNDSDLAQVALACGFSDQSYFSRVFRKAHQITPGEFRRTGRATSAPSTKIPKLRTTLQAR